MPALTLPAPRECNIPPNIKIIRVMCSGRVDPTFILKALEAGADGVLITGCHPGDCHYIAGNYKIARRIPLLKKMLSQFGIGSERIRLEWVSASEGAKFAKVANDFTQSIKKLGPGPFNKQLLGEEKHG